MPLVDADFPSQFTFQVLFDTGAAGSLSVNLEGSLDGSTGWTAIGNTTTLAGGSTPAGISAWKYIACNVVAYTLGTSHNLTCKFIAQTSTAGLGTHGLITPGDCTSWFNGTTLEDLGSPCGTGTGNVTGTFTTNKIPKGTGVNTLGDSSITDNGTTVSTSEPAQAPIQDTGANGMVYNALAGFGIAGNGSTDDTSAITALAATAAANNAQVFFPGGHTYVICGATVPASVRLFGPAITSWGVAGAAILKSKAGCATNMIAGTTYPISYVTIENLSFDGNNIAPVGVFIDTGISWTLQGNYFNNFPSTASHVKGGGALYLHYTHNTHSGNGYALNFQNSYSSNSGSTYYGCNACWIQENVFSAANGVRISGSVHVHNNDFELALASGINAALDFTDIIGTEEADASYNYFELTHGSASVMRAIYASGLPVNVVGNTIYGDSTASSIAIDVLTPYSVQITGNSIGRWIYGINLGYTTTAAPQQLVAGNWFYSVTTPVEPAPATRQAMTGTNGPQFLSLPLGTFVLNSALMTPTCTVADATTSLDLSKCNDFYLPYTTITTVNAVINGVYGEKFTISASTGAKVTLAEATFNMCGGTNYLLPAHELHSFVYDYTGVIREVCPTLAASQLPNNVQNPVSDLLCAHGGDTTIGALTITSGSSTSSTMTFGVASGGGVWASPVGQTVTIAGVTSPASGENGNYVVASATGTTIVLTSTNNPGNWVAGGTISFACNNTAGNDAIAVNNIYFNTVYGVGASYFATSGKRLEIAGDFSIFTQSATPPTLQIAQFDGSTQVYTPFGVAPNAALSGGTFQVALSQTATTDANGHIWTVPMVNQMPNMVPANATGSSPPPLIGTSAFNIQWKPVFAATGLLSCTCNDAGNQCGFTLLVCSTNDVITLGSFNKSCNAATAATVKCTGTNAIANGTAITVTNTGFACTSGTGMTASGTCGGDTCTGSAAITGVLGGPQGNALRLVGLTVKAIN
jgi:hypothetical protein